MAAGDRSAGEYESLNNMPRVGLTGTVNLSREGDVRKLAVDLRNGDQGLALATRLKVVDVASGLLVAPILYADNYFALLRGEAKQVTLEFSAKSVSGDEVTVQLEGWNVTPGELARVRVK